MTSSEPTGATIQTIITAITSLVTAAIGWVQDFADVIVSEPIILIFVVVAFVGLGVGLIRRMMRL